MLPIYHRHYERLQEIAAQHFELFGVVIPGLTGEIGEYHVARILNLRLATKQNNPGYDAKSEVGIKHQIKSCVPGKSIGHFGHINIKQDWHIVDFCFMDNSYKVQYIYQMNKEKLNLAQTKSGKTYSSITGQQVIKYGLLKYVIKPDISRLTAIRQLLLENKSTKNILKELKRAGYDISKKNSIYSCISSVRTGKL